MLPYKLSSDNTLVIRKAVCFWHQQSTGRERIMEEIRLNYLLQLLMLGLFFFNSSGLETMFQDMSLSLWKWLISQDMSWQFTTYQNSRK